MRIAINFRNDLPLDTLEQRSFYARMVREHYGHYTTTKEISDHMHAVFQYRAMKALYAQPQFSVTFEWNGGHREGNFKSPAEVIKYYQYLVDTFPGCYTSMVITSKEGAK